MAKPVTKKTRKTNSKKKTKPAKAAIESQTKAAEYVDCLKELHKLQGVLLAQLGKEL